MQNSLLLSNIYLDAFDQTMTVGGHRLVRFCSTRRLAKKALTRDPTQALEKAAKITPTAEAVGVWRSIQGDKNE